ncbi:tetratricopeptide repeat protein [Pseudoxanthomonas kalamensis]|uniref:tetratricopeptide repeat protein n=1 Tax=Pseudoxanthomonas kalamensis TaxID=289483 RepID=UPI00139122EA|nr:tetratricopeptide repeat protein [Pseudoxanthomonas kalamensis]
MQDKIIEALRQQTPERAIATADEWLAVASDNAQAYRWRAIARQQAGDAEGAVDDIDRAIVLSPEDSRLHMLRASLLLGQQRTDEATDALNRASQANPNEFGAYVLQAQLAFARGDLQQAEEFNRLAARVEPDHPRLALIDSMVALQRNEVDRALRLISQAIERAPEDAHLRHAAGFVYMAKQHWGFAEQAFRRVREEVPGTERLRTLISGLMARQGRLVDAADELEPLLDDANAPPSLLQVAGRLRLQAGQPERALPRLLAAFAKAPSDPQILPLLRQAWQAGGTAVGEVRAQLEAALATASGVDALWATRLTLEPVDSEEALAVIDRWLQAMPDSPAGWSARMNLQRRSGDLEQAEASAKRVLQASPGNAEAHAVIAERLRQRDPELAIAYLQELRDKAIGPGRAVLDRWLARMHADSGRYEEAIALWSGQAKEQAANLLPLPPVSHPVDQVPRGAWPEMGEVDPEQPVALFLWGAPGSGVERVAAELGAFTAFRDDRLQPNAPVDGFQRYVSIEELSSGQLDGAEMIREWREGLPARGIHDGRIIEWLLWWDNALLHALRPHLPGSRLLVVMRDPRDMLLEWLAFGTPSAIGMLSPLQAAQWMRAVLWKIMEMNRDQLLGHALLKLDGIEDDRQAIIEAIREATGLEVPQRADVTAAKFFPAGHWRRYAQALEEPFAVLAPVAAAFGYKET